MDRVARRGLVLRRLPDRRQVRRRARRVWYGQAVSTVSRVRHAHHDLGSTAMILGPKRSGTTWVQELLSGGPGTCPIFEPFSNDPRARQLGYSKEPVVAPGEAAPELATFLDRVMRGGRVTRWSLQLASVGELLRAERLVVKHVQLNLAAGWLTARFPESPTLIVVRHPCAVVQSMLAVEWTEDSFDAVLGRRSPEEAARMAELVDGRRTAAAAFAAMWAVQVGALLHETDPERVQLVAYEPAVDDPAGVLGPVMESMGLPRPPDLLGRSAQPSKMASRGSVTRAAGDPVTAWVDRLPSADRDEVLAVVARAGLAGYGADPRPDLDALREEHRRS